MLMMTKTYAEARNNKAQRTHDYLVAHMGVKPFKVPVILAIPNSK